MKSFIAALLILVIIFSFAFPLTVKIGSLKKEILLHTDKISPQELSRSAPHVDTIVDIIDNNISLFEYSVPKNIYEPMVISAKKLQSYAKNGSAELFSAEYEIFIYYTKQLTF